jgi:hypothetical protein
VKTPPEQNCIAATAIQKGELKTIDKPRQYIFGSTSNNSNICVGGNFTKAAL